MSAPGLPFDDAPPAGRPLGSPTIEARRERGHAAAAAAARHADAVIARWLSRAGALAQMFAATQAGPWLIEDARAFAESRGLEAPPDARAWGGVAQRLRRARLIIQTGEYRAAKTSNGAARALWRGMK